MSEQYDRYLTEHRNNVQRAAKWMLENLGVQRWLSKSDIDRFSVNIKEHDLSKYSYDEYDAYDEYFYSDDGGHLRNFNRAWLHHIHNNPHHWQYWILMNDDGKYRDPNKITVLDMPRVYVLEMIADWWSFSWGSGNLGGMFDWYDFRRDNIILHENTRDFVEAVLCEIRQILIREKVIPR